MSRVFENGASSPAAGGRSVSRSSTQRVSSSADGITNPSLRISDDVRVDEIPVDDIPRVSAGVGYRVVKRMMDIAGAVVGLTLFMPVMAVCAALIKWQDGGPILFWQERVGERGKRFHIVKFRSMVMDAAAMMDELREQNQHDDDRTFKILNDPRITPVGRFMRRLSLDEFPQFWNVLVGQMSLVGPRPALPSEVAMYGKSDLMRLAVRPGLTCIWQVSGRSNLDFQQQVELDIAYIEQRGVVLDVMLILRTLPAVLDGDGAA